MHTTTQRYERAARRRGHRHIAGADEVGRGAWAGPIIAAAVILPERHGIRGITDSKILTRSARERLYDMIIHEAIAWSVAELSNTSIDHVGMGPANREVLVRAITQLRPVPDYVLIDAYVLPLPMMSKSIIRGDAHSESIAAASIVAKVTRDRIMTRYHATFPEYGFDRSKGYGTATHRAALETYGCTTIHRRSFMPMKNMA